ncbi:MAG: hypothetical protein HYT30_01155 [Parcubacteria group bacterium]|nr:hypothetical protein [Parcubacteria group bacterium]
MVPWKGMGRKQKVKQMRAMLVAVITLWSTASAYAWQEENPGSRVEIRQETGVFCVDEQSAQEYLKQNMLLKSAAMRDDLLATKCWVDARTVAGDFSSGARIVQVLILEDGRQLTRFLVW